jgi:hypothetical protein
MKRQGHASTLIALILLAVSNSSAQASDWISFYRLEAEAVASFYGTDRSSNNDDFLRDTEWRAGVHLAQKGYILDPGIAWFLLDFEPVYIGGKIKSNTSKDDRDGKFLSYLVQLSMLDGTPGPFSFDLSAVRKSNLNTVTLGSRYESEIEINSASTQWKNPAFPMQFIYREESLKQEFRSSLGGSISERDELLKTLTVTGRSSKMDLKIEHLSMDDRVITRNHDFNLDQAILNHRLHWGSNSRLLSRWNYYDRTGFNANKRLSIIETAVIQHAENVFSRSIYSFSSVTQFIKTDEHTIETELSHQLYNNLTTSARVFGGSLNSDNLDETRWRTELRGQYNKQDLLFGATVNAGLTVSYQETDRDSSFGLVEVVDESHVVPLGGMIILNRRFIISATIIVTSADSTLVFTEGIDYFVFPLTDDLTQLQVIPGGRISIGDTILVSYKAQVLPSQEFSTTATRANLGFYLGWMSFSHYRYNSDDKLLSGAGESFLNDYRDITTNIEFRWRMAKIDTVIGAERRSNTTGNFKSETNTFRQYFSWVAFGETFWNLSITESFGKTNTLETDLYNLELSASWQPLMSLQIRPVIGAWRRLDEGPSVIDNRREDTFITAGFNMRWMYRKVTLDFAYHYNRRTTDARQTNENRLMFFLRRRF